MIRRVLPVVCLIVLLVPTASQAQWFPDGAAACGAANNQGSPSVVSDGAGGVVLAWHDYRDGSYDIYVQQVNALGVPGWTVDGVAVCTAVDDQLFPVVASDGAGGAIIAWYDYRSGKADIYAQLVNAAGTPLWAADGVALCTAVNDQVLPAIMSDGVGGAIVAWHDYRGADADIYVQRVSKLGATQWTADGVLMCGAVGQQYVSGIVSDGADGAIVVWDDDRGADYDIYARRVNALGVAQWAADGVALCTAASDQYLSKTVSDGAGGAIVTWADFRTGVDHDIFAQRVNASGVSQWVLNGEWVSAAVNDQSEPDITSDGTGGVIIVWRDYRSGSNNDIYAQRLSASGAAQWLFDGAPVCTQGANQYDPAIAADGTGGAVVIWKDDRAGNYDIYAQRVDVTAATPWTPDGVVLCEAPYDQSEARIVADGEGGCIVGWTDFRSGFGDIYAQRVETTYGYWGHPEPIVVSAADIPNDQGGKVAVNWTASGRDRPVPATIDYYSIWRAVDVVAFTRGEAPPVAITAIENVGPDVTSGVYTTMPASTYYWELVGSQTAYRLPSYSYSAPTRADSTSGDPGIEFFMVAAHDKDDEHIAFFSNAMSGHSVDNLAPSAPLSLTAQRVGNDVELVWNRVEVPDLSGYSVYRAGASGVTPIPLNFLGSVSDTTLLDTGAPTTNLYYIVTAVDIHENESAASDEASVSPVTGVGPTPSLSALTVLQNHPNPFAGSTELQIGLPADSDISVEVFDVAGRRVSSFEIKAAGAGWQSVPYSGHDNTGRPLPSGVYLYRVRANGTAVTHKMVIAR